MSVRATKLGSRVLAGAGAVLIAGLVVGYAELTIVGVAGVVAGLAGFLWLLPRPPLRIRREIAPVRVQRGDPAFGLVEVANTGRLPVGGILARERVGDERVEVPLEGIRPGRRRQATYRLPTGQRGVFSVGPLEVVLGDPLALFERRRSLDDPARLWVHPRTYPLRLPPVGRVADLEGLATNELLEGGMNFHELREYVPGDDLRRVHWRTTARAGTLMVRTHVDTRRPEVLVVLDDRTGSYPGPDAFEEVMDFGASAAAASLAAGYPTRVQLMSGQALDAVAEEELGGMLDRLAEVRLDDQAGLSLSELVELGPASGSWALMVTGADGIDELDQLGGLRSRFTTVVVACVMAVETRVSTPLGIELLTAPDASGLTRLWNL